MKNKISTEFSYILGVLFLAFGTALITVSGFGVSMIVAPAYLVHLKVSEILPFFSFGMSEYLLQGLLIIVMCFVLVRFHLSYLFSFFTAVIYGFCLDGFLFVLDVFKYDALPVRILLFSVGMMAVTLGVSFFFHSYISPEVYELFVKKVSKKYGIELHKFKKYYDLTSFAIALILSFVLFGKIHGIGIGTVVTALLNGKLISFWSGILENKLEFYDRFKLRKYFDEE